MNRGLKDYLANRCTPAPVNQAVIDDLFDAMKRAVPEIAESIRQREQAAAIVRANPTLLWVWSESGQVQIPIPRFDRIGA